MKHLIFTVLLSALCFSVYGGETAQPSNDLLETIQRLETKIDALQASVDELKRAGMPAPRASRQPAIQRDAASRNQSRESGAADRFPVTDVIVQEMFGGGASTAQGQITNNSGRDYAMTIFNLSFFDSAGKLLGAADFSLTDFADGETATFEGVSTNDLEGWTSYRVRLNTGM